MKLKIGILILILGNLCLAKSQTIIFYKDSGSTIEFFESLLGNSKEYVKNAFESSEYIETDSPSDNIILFKHKMFVFSIALSFHNNKCSSIIWDNLLSREAYSQAINFGMYQTDKSGIVINDESFKRQTYYYHPELDLVYIIDIVGSGKANYTLSLNKFKNVDSYLTNREKYFKQKKEKEKRAFDGTESSEAQRNTQNESQKNNESKTRQDETKEKNMRGSSFSLSGRSLSGALPRPEYNIQEEGVVIVEITVDRNGVVTNVQPILRGTTTNNSYLWRVASEAALKARFNADNKAPAMQKGTITYQFILN